jgi:NAD kinase
MNKEIRKIDTSTLLLARKLTDFEYTARKNNLTEAEAYRHFLKKGTDGEGIVSAHQRFNEALVRVCSYFKGGIPVIEGERLRKRDIRQRSRVLVLGGDDTFKGVSHFLTDQVVVGINSDPETSNGALLNFTAESLEGLVPCLEAGDCGYEEWTRLEASIDGKKLPRLAISEVFTGSRDRLKSSRFLLEKGGFAVRLSNSGILVATGTGSTGWYNGAASCEHGSSPVWERTAKEARFFTTEAFFGRLNARFPRSGILSGEDELILTNRSHSRGVVSIDSVFNRVLPRGSAVSIKISDSSLRVAKLFF